MTSRSNLSTKIPVDGGVPAKAFELEVHTDAFGPGRRVLLIDDVLATGGTMRACRDLVQSTGAEVVACAFVIELSFLRGRARLQPGEVFSLVTY